MTQLSLDMPSLLMVLSFTINMIVALFDPTEIPISKEIGAAILACGALFFVYVLYYLRSGFFGETEPKLDFLITAGPYGFCRHPLYLSFIIIMFGIDLMSRISLRDQSPRDRFLGISTVGAALNSKAG